MAKEKSYIIVDCEQSLLSYTLNPTNPPSFADVKLKDDSLLNVLNRLSKNPTVSIIVVTIYPNIYLLKNYLKQQLPETSFSVLYVPPLLVRSSKKVTLQNEDITTTPASESPPPGYTLLYNHTLQAPNGGWENYAKILSQRLENIDFDIRVEKTCNKEEKKKQEESSPLYSEERSYSPGYFKRATKILEDEKRSRMTKSPIQRIIDENTSRSPVRSSSPLSRS